ncbi:MAG: hypothetical protein LC790_17970 [Actinobacteria bacterium]|nr:hypothetical protein [Actinomycetota bacterium]
MTGTASHAGTQRQGHGGDDGKGKQHASAQADRGGDAYATERADERRDPGTAAHPDRRREGAGQRKARGAPSGRPEGLMFRRHLTRPHSPHATQ